MAKTDLTNFSATLLKAFGMNIPVEFGSPVSNLVEKLIKTAGGNIEKALVFHADAVPKYIVEKYPDIFVPVHQEAPCAEIFDAVMPSITPVCFAAMYSGRYPKANGVDHYVQPVLSEKLVQPTIIGNTVVDEFVRAGKRVAVITCSDGCIASMLSGRGADLFIIPGDDDDAMFQQAMKVIQTQEYDIIFLYQLSYDTTMHRFGPESRETLEDLRILTGRFGEISKEARRMWQDKRCLTIFNADHGSHITQTGGSHGEKIHEDMEMEWFFGAWRRKE